jgi:ABC-type sugar transport system ATPase subunit
VGAKYDIYGTINEFADPVRKLIGISSEIPKFRGVSGPIYALSELESPWTCRARR